MAVYFSASISLMNFMSMNEILNALEHTVFHLGLAIISIDSVLQFEMKLLWSHLLSVTRKISSKSI